MVLEGAKLIDIGKDPRLQMGWKRINLESVRRGWREGSEFGEMRKIFWESGCHDSYKFRGQRDPMGIFIYFKTWDTSYVQCTDSESTAQCILCMTTPCSYWPHQDLIAQGSSLFWSHRVDLGCFQTPWNRVVHLCCNFLHLTVSVIFAHASRSSVICSSWFLYGGLLNKWPQFVLGQVN